MHTHIYSGCSEKETESVDMQREKWSGQNDEFLRSGLMFRFNRQIIITKTERIKKKWKYEFLHDGHWLPGCHLRKLHSSLFCVVEANLINNFHIPWSIKYNNNHQKSTFDSDEKTKQRERLMWKCIRNVFVYVLNVTNTIRSIMKHLVYEHRHGQRLTKYITFIFMHSGTENQHIFVLFSLLFVQWTQ